MESELRRHRADVARRLHHPQPRSSARSRRLRQEPEADEPAARPLLQQDDRTSTRPPGAASIVSAIEAGVPMPAFTTALAFYDGYRSERLPANLLQAQRDYFGAHTYERIDKPRGEFFHTNWTGRGGRVASGHVQRLIRQYLQEMNELRSEYPEGRRPRFLVARRADPSSRPRDHPVPQGTRVPHPRQRRRVQLRRQPGRLLSA